MTSAYTNTTVTNERTTKRIMLLVDDVYTIRSLTLIPMNNN